MSQRLHVTALSPSTSPALTSVYLLFFGIPPALVGGRGDTDVHLGLSTQSYTSTLPSSASLHWLLPTTKRSFSGQG